MFIYFSIVSILFYSVNDLTSEAECLKLEVWDDQYTIKAGECSKVLQPLCSKLYFVNLKDKTIHNNIDNPIS